MIYLCDTDTKVVSYSSSSRTGKHVLTLKLEYPDAMTMAYDVQSLENKLAKQKEEAKTKPKTARKTKQVEKQNILALPAPDGDVQ